MDARRHLDRRVDPVEGEVWTDAIPRPEQHEIAAVALPRHVVEGRSPERSLPLQIVDAQND
jgi:hypothetical protein